MSRRVKHVFLICLLTAAMSSCSKPTRMDLIYSQDPLLNVYWSAQEQSEINFQIYREGAAGLSGNKGHGGCGCN